MQSNSNIDRKVIKRTKRLGKSPKPFKSGLKVNTVKGETVNPYTDKPAFTFLEDDSVVDREKCVILDNEEVNAINKYIEKGKIV